MSDIQFWLTYNNRAELLRLPVNPKSIRYDLGKMGFHDVEIAALGEFTVIGNQQLFGISFESFFPRDYNAAYCEYENFPDPWSCVNMIKNWAISGNPMRLTIPGTPINLACTIRDFVIDAERGGEPGDIYYSITFKEYKFISVKQVQTTSANTAKAAASGKKRPPSESPKSGIHTVMSGETLWGIAKKTLGSGDKWKTIYDANKSVIGPDPGKIKPGMKLVVPS